MPERGILFQTSLRHLHYIFWEIGKYCEKKIGPWYFWLYYDDPECMGQPNNVCFPSLLLLDDSGLEKLGTRYVAYKNWKWHAARCKASRFLASFKLIRSTKPRCARRSSLPALRSREFWAPKNQIFSIPVITYHLSPTVLR